MYKNETQLRTRYSETDQMSVVYYGNYPQYFEVGRVEALRDIGLSYSNMEKSGVMMPVHEMQIKYLRPALYDDLIKIKTIIKELPKSKIRFDHEIYDSKGQLLTTGFVQLVFVDKVTRRPKRCPEDLYNKLAEHINSD